MSEVHKIVMEIDAARAQSGAKSFVGALKTIVDAVSKLEKSTDGTFKKINDHIAAAQKVSNKKINPVDGNTNKKLSEFEALITKVTSSLSTMSGHAKTAAGDLAALSKGAKATGNAYAGMTKEVLGSNAALNRHIQLAKQAQTELAKLAAIAGKMPRVRWPNESGRGSGSSGSSSGSRGSNGINGGGGGGSRGGSRGGPKPPAFASDEALAKSIAAANKELSVLDRKLRAVEGNASANKLLTAYARLMNVMHQGAVEQKEFGAAVARWSTEVTRAKTRLDGLNNGWQTAAKRSRDAATAQGKLADVEARVTSTMAASGTQVERLKAQLHGIGDASGVANLSNALAVLHARLSQTGISMREVKTAEAQFKVAVADADRTLIHHNQSQSQAAQRAKDMRAAQLANVDAARRLESQMRSTAGAANATSEAWHRATGNMRGLENAMNSTYQIGSAFRTLFGVLTLGSFVTSIWSANTALDQFMTTMEVAMGSGSAAFAQADYIGSVSDRLGTSIGVARDNYSKFAVSAQLAGVSAAETGKIFESVATAMAVLGRSSEDQNLAFLAVEQMMSKGTISSEELRRQLGERLPGAVNMMADAVGVSTAELQKMLKLGELNSAEVLPKFADQLMEVFGPGLANAGRRASTNLGRLQNEMTKFYEAVGQSGLMNQLAATFQDLAEAFGSEEMATAAKGIGEGFAWMVETIGNGVVTLVENVEHVRDIFEAVFVGLAVRTVFRFTAAVLSSFQLMQTFSLSLRQGAMAATQQEIAINTLTASLGANTAALRANAGASAAAAAGLVTTGAAARTAGAGLQLFIKGFSIFATIAAVVATAGYAIADSFDMFGSSAEDNGERLHSVLDRAGVEYETLATRAESSFARIRAAQALDDINFSNGFTDTSRGAGLPDAMGAAITSGDWDAFVPQIGGQIVADIANALPGGGMVGQYGQSGLSEEMFKGLSGVAQSSIRTAIAEYADVQKGTMSPEMFRADTMIERSLHLEGAAFFDALLSAVEDAALNRRARTENRFTLAEDFSGASSMFASGRAQLANSASGVIAGTTTIQDFRKAGDDLVASGSLMASDVKYLREELTAALGRGDPDANAFREIVSGWLNPRTVDLEAEQRQLATDAGTDARNRASVDGQAQSLIDWFQRRSTAVSSMGRGDLYIPEARNGYSVPGVTNADSGLEAVQTAAGMTTVPNTTGLDTTAYMQRIKEETVEATEAQEAWIAALEAIPEGERNFLTMSTALDTLTGSTALQDDASQRYLETQRSLAREMGRVGGALPITSAELQRLTTLMTVAGTPAREQLDLLIQQVKAAEESGTAMAVQADNVAKLTDKFFGAADAMDEFQASAGQTSNINGLTEALAALGDELNRVRDAGSEAMTEAREALKVAGMSARDAFIYSETDDFRDAFDVEVAKIDEAITAAVSASGTSPSANMGVIAELQAQRDALTSERDSILNNLGDVAAQEFDAREEKKDQGETPEEKRLKEIIKFTESLNDKRNELLDTGQAYMMVANGMFETVEMATLYGEAQRMLSGDALIAAESLMHQMEAVQHLNRELEALAADPMRDFIQSLPTYTESVNQIEQAMIEGMSSSFITMFDAAGVALDDFIRKGKVDMDELWEGIKGSIASFAGSVSDTIQKIMADRLTAMILKSVNLDGIFGTQRESQTQMVMDQASAALAGQEMAVPVVDALVSGGNHLYSSVNAGATEGGTAISTSISSSLSTSGADAGLAMGTAVEGAGGTISTTFISAGDTVARAIASAITTAADSISTRFGGATGLGTVSTGAVGSDRVDLGQFGINAADLEYEHGLPAGHLSRMVSIESSGNPNAVSPSGDHRGLTQMGLPAWQDAMPGVDYMSNVFDPVQNVMAGARYDEIVKNSLQNDLGRQVSGGEIYLGHQQGPGAAAALLANPGGNAVDVLRSIGINNAEAYIEGNGGSVDQTAGAFSAMWIEEYERGAETMARLCWKSLRAEEVKIAA